MAVFTPRDGPGRLGALSLLLSLQAAALATTAEPPNVLFLWADDVGYGTTRQALSPSPVISSY